MPSGRNKLTPATIDETKKLLRIAPLELYVAEYSDGGGTVSTRIVARVGKSEKFYFPFPPGTEDNAKHAASWLNTEILQRLGGKDSLPDNTAVLPAGGSPLEDGDGV